MKNFTFKKVALHFSFLSMPVMPGCFQWLPGHCLVVAMMLLGGFEGILNGCKVISGDC